MFYKNSYLIPVFRYGVWWCKAARCSSLLSLYFFWISCGNKLLYVFIGKRAFMNTWSFHLRSFWNQLPQLSVIWLLLLSPKHKYCYVFITIFALIIIIFTWGIILILHILYLFISSGTFRSHHPCSSFRFFYEFVIQIIVRHRHLLFCWSFFCCSFRRALWCRIESGSNLPLVYLSVMLHIELC